MPDTLGNSRFIETAAAASSGWKGGLDSSNRPVAPGGTRGIRYGPVEGGRVARQVLHDSHVSRFPGLMFPRAGYSVYLPAAPQTTVLPPSVFSQSPLATGCHNKASIFEITAQVAIKRFTFAVKETLITLPAGERPTLLDGLYYTRLLYRII